MPPDYVISAPDDATPSCREEMMAYAAAKKCCQNSAAALLRAARRFTREQRATP